jgi:hypothetical protein
MTIRARALIVAIACGLCACEAAGQTSQAPPADPASPAASSMEVQSPTDDTTLTIPRVMIAPTPEMLKAALTGDPDAMRDSVIATASTCQAASSCPAQFGSCGTWSTPSLCNETCGLPLCRCMPLKDCDGEPPEPRGTDTFNSFRVCFDSGGNSCTEWSSTTSTFCGC